MTQHLHDVLLGVLRGDCLGAQYEFGRPDPHRPLEVGWSAFGHRPGIGTDDSETTIALAHGLLDAAEVGRLASPEDAIAARLLEWFETDPADVGNTTRRGLVTYRELRDPARSGPVGERTITNGSLMRSAPFLLAYADVEQAASLAASSSRVTHGDPVVLDCVAMYVRLLFATSEGRDDLPAGSTADVDAARAQAVDALQHSPDRIPCPGIGYGPYVLALAFWSAWSPLAVDFGTGLEHVIRVGGDTDTNGAICGAVLAARFGVPADAVAELDPGRVDEVRELSRRLIELRARPR